MQHLSILSLSVEELRRQLARYQRIVENHPDLVCCFSEDTTLTFVNNAYAHYFNQPVAALQGSSCLRLIAAEDQACVRSAIASLSPAAPISTSEHAVVINGNVRWQRWTNQARFDEQGKLIEIQATGQDITASKHAAMSLDVVRNADGSIGKELTAANDVTALQKAEQALAQRCRQQAAVAQLGQLAVSTRRIRPVLDAAVVCLRETLDTDYTSLLIKSTRKETLSMRASAGWPAKSGKNSAAAKATLDSLVGFTLMHGKPIIVNDWQNETRFDNSRQLQQGLKSTLCCCILGENENAFGVLVAHTLEARQFSEDDITLLEGIANLVSDTVIKQRARSALLEEKERLRITLESIGDAVITTDNGGQVSYLNPVAERLTGWPLAEARGQSVETVFNIIDEGTRARVVDPTARCVIEQRTVGLADNTVLISRDGFEYAIQDSAAPIRDRDDNIVGAVMVFSDVSESRELAREISHQATHDALTGLINRREFERRLQRVLESAHDESSEHGLCFLDLDQFKVVNDSCGHAAGDELLRQVAALFKQQIRNHDTLARLGGDEFSVLMEHCPLAAAKQVAQKLRRALQDFRFHWDGKTFTAGVSIGLVSIDNSSASVSSILSAADNACYAAKNSGRNRIHLYRSDDAASLHRHGQMQWINRLQQAPENDRFRLYCQTIAPASKHAREHSGVHIEVLLRMLDDQDRIVAPGAFLPAAERYQLASRVDRWVVTAVLNWLENHRGELDQLGCCAINLSGQSLGDDMFEGFVLRLLDETGIPGEKLCFEITETAAIINLMNATRLMQSLKKRGCRFALDDFGSGLSSFGYLKNLPVDYLKIDGMFVKDLLRDPIDFAMVRSINEIGQLMGKQTIAEYVENASILQRLQEIGVDWAQGFGIDRPQPLQDWWQAHCSPAKPGKLTCDSIA